MTVHFVHVGKTGGTAIKRALTNRRLAYWNEERADRVPETPFGRIRLHNHDFTMTEVPPGDHVFFCVRDPIARFLSGFYSRLTKGQPRYYFEWTEAEREAFEAFPTPQKLATALASDDAGERGLAQSAMRHIRHLGFMDKNIGTPRQLRARLGQILFIARQETPSSDWEQLKSVLRCRARPSFRRIRCGRIVATHRWTARSTTTPSVRCGTGTAATTGSELLRPPARVARWDAGPEPPAGADRLRRRARRLRGIPAVLPRHHPRFVAAFLLMTGTANVSLVQAVAAEAEAGWSCGPPCSTASVRVRSPRSASTGAASPPRCSPTARRRAPTT